MFYVLWAFLVSLCRSVPPEFLRSFFLLEMTLPSFSYICSKIKNLNIPLRIQKISKDFFDSKWLPPSNSDFFQKKKTCFLGIPYGPFKGRVTLPKQNPWNYSENSFILVGWLFPKGELPILCDFTHQSPPLLCRCVGIGKRCKILSMILKMKIGISYMNRP